MRISVGKAVDSRGVGAYLATVTLTLLEYTGAVVGGHVPKASESVVDMLAPDGRHWAWFACTEAEYAVGDKVLRLVGGWLVGTDTPVRWQRGVRMESLPSIREFLRADRTHWRK